MKERWSLDEAVYRIFGTAGVLLLGAVLYLHFSNADRPLPTKPAVMPPPAPPANAVASLPPTGKPAITATPEPPTLRSPHVSFDQRACLARTGTRVTDRHTVHRWVDAQGITHYSDTLPQGDELRDYRQIVARETQPVLVEIEAANAVLPGHVRDHATRDAKAIARVFDDVLGIDTRGGLALRIVFAGTDAAFRQHAGRDPVSTTGVYRSANRTIVVRTQPRTEATLSILRHEITHALIHEWLGHLPTALNEGLAEYFQQFTASGMGGHVDPNDYARRMRADRAASNTRQYLTTLLGMPHENFHGSQRDAHYTRSLALVSVLMAEPSHRSALAAVLRAQRSNPCTPVDAASVLEKHWPGGLNALAEAWSKHQLGQSLRVHSY